MSSPFISLHNPFDPVFWIATGIALAAAILYAGVVLWIALYSKNKKRRKRARKLLRMLFGGSR